MQQSAWILRGLVLVVALAVVGVAVAEDGQLAKARMLFEQQEYEAAQLALDEVGREELNESEQGAYDELQRRLPLARAGLHQATRDMIQAGQDFAAERWDAAEHSYRAVLDNEYALAVMRTEASARLTQIDEKRRLAEAAAPTGVLATAPPQAQVVPEEPVAVAEPPQAGPRRLTPIDEMRGRDSLLWQRAVAQAQELAARAREAAARADYQLARQLADMALQKIEAARSYAEPATKYTDAKSSITQLQREIAAADDAWQLSQAQREREEIAARVAKRRELQEQHRREKVEQLFNTAAQLRAQQRFDEAAEVLRQILHIDPGNARARNYLEIAEDYASLLHQQRWQDDVNLQFREAIVNAQEALIPWDYEVLYPKNWRELSERRSRAGTGIGGAREDSELNRKLDEVLPEFQFDETPLHSVIGHLQDVQQINIAVDWEDLTLNGIEPSKPVSLALRGLPFRTVLKEVLAQVGGETTLAYSVVEGLLRVASKEKLDRDKYVLVYDVRDLLMSAARFSNAARLDPGAAPVVTGRSRWNEGSLFESPGHSEQRSSLRSDDTDEMVHELIGVIRQTVSPDSWQTSGGGDASIRELNGQLIVYNTSDAHTQVRGLLDQLRARRALQISIEARFLDVTSNFLEEFGVDLDFVFNSASAGYDQAFGSQGAVTDPFSGAPVLIPRQFGKTGVLPVSPGYGTPMTSGVGILQPYTYAGLVPYTEGIGPHMSRMTPIAAQQGSFGLTNPGNINTAVPGSFASQAVNSPALNIAGSFLDNLQVDFLIRATQANQRSAIVQAPRIVMENWSRTYIQVGRTRDYVSTINATVAEGAALAQPVTAQAASGTLLSVQGTISADRRYVAVRVTAQQLGEPSFERFEVTRAAGNSPGVFIQLVDRSFVQLETQVHIPDGGTVLLGGLKQAGEVEVEAGVPILSKIPVMKRFFSNRTIVKDTRTLLILMKSKIIIQDEAEEEAFPTFSSLGRG